MQTGSLSAQPFLSFIRALSEKSQRENFERKFRLNPSSDARERTAVLAGLGAVGKHPAGVGDAFREIPLVPRLAVLVFVFARAFCDQRTSISSPIKTQKWFLRIRAL